MPPKMAAFVYINTNRRRFVCSSAESQVVSRPLPAPGHRGAASGHVSPWYRIRAARRSAIPGTPSGSAAAGAGQARPGRRASRLSYVLSRVVFLVNGWEVSSCGSWRQMPSCMVCYPGTHATASAFVMKHELVIDSDQLSYGSHIAPNPARWASILHTPYAMGLGFVLLTQRRNERDPFPLPASAGRPTSCATSTPVSGCSNPFRCLINSNISLISSGVGGCQSSAKGLSVSGLIMMNPLAKQPQQSPRLIILYVNRAASLRATKAFYKHGGVPGNSRGWPCRPGRRRPPRAIKALPIIVTA